MSLKKLIAIRLKLLQDGIYLFWWMIYIYSDGSCCFNVIAFELMLSWLFCEYLGHNCPDLRLIMLFFFFCGFLYIHVILKRGSSYTVDVLILERTAKSLQCYGWQENKLPFSGIFSPLLIPRSRFRSILCSRSCVLPFLSDAAVGWSPLLLHPFACVGFSADILKGSMWCTSHGDFRRGERVRGCLVFRTWLTGCLPCLCLRAEQLGSEEPRGVLGHWALIHGS